MDTPEALLLVALCAFYAIYFIKMLALRRQGIDGNIMGKGDKPRAARRVELALKAVTVLGAAAQLASVLFPGLPGRMPAPKPIAAAGVFLAWAGCVFFLMSVTAMKTNWRAGFSAEQRTELVTDGVYRISRNPAFVGFDLLYLGTAAACPNITIFVAAAAAMTLFHVQILGEERHLYATFGDAYTQYQSRVGRYLGWRA